MSANTRPTLDRHSTDTRPTLDRHSTDTIDRHSADISVEYRPTLSADISADTRPTSRSTLGKISTDSWSSVGRDVGQVCRSSMSVECRLTKYRPILATGDIDRYWRYSTDTQPISWPIFGRHINRHLVERRSTCSSSW